MPSRRDVIRMTDEEVDAFLRSERTMNVATVGPDGRPHLVAMWYAFVDGAPAFWTYGKSQKVVNLRRDPHITCLVESGDSYDRLRGVELLGTGALIEDRDAVLAFGRDLSERYSGPLTEGAVAAVEQMGAKRVVVRVDVEKVVSWDHTKLGGTY